MPLGRQDERAWKAIFPWSISSLSFFITSLTHGFRLGLERSPIRQLCPWLMKGCFGSWTTGEAEPSTGGKVAPSVWTHPPSPPDRSGGEAGCAATAATQASETKMPLARQSFDKANLDIVPLLARVLLGADDNIPPWCR